MAAARTERLVIANRKRATSRKVSGRKGLASLLWWLLQHVTAHVRAVDDDQLVVAADNAKRVHVIGVIVSIELGLNDRAKNAQVPAEVVVLVRKCVFDDRPCNLRDRADLAFISDYRDEFEVGLRGRQPEI
jgi:hypothetical protein